MEDGYISLDSNMDTSCTLDLIPMTVFSQKEDVWRLLLRTHYSTPYTTYPVYLHALSRIQQEEVFPKEHEQEEGQEDAQRDALTHFEFARMQGCSLSHDSDVRGLFTMDFILSLVTLVHISARTMITHIRSLVKLVSQYGRISFTISCVIVDT